VIPPARRTRRKWYGWNSVNSTDSLRAKQKYLLERADYAGVVWFGSAQRGSKL
jgi:hypothetical protein